MPNTTLSFSQEVACSADLQLHAPHWPEANKPHGKRLSHANREGGLCEDILVDKVVLICMATSTPGSSVRELHLSTRLQKFTTFSLQNVPLEPGSSLPGTSDVSHQTSLKLPDRCVFPRSNRANRALRNFSDLLIR